MAENTGEVIAGGVVVVVAAGFLFFAAQTTGFSGAQDGYELTASFRSVDGISAGTDVRLAGVKVGSVQSMNLNTETYRADVTVRMNAGIEVPEDSSIAVSSEGLLGGNFVELVPGGSPFMLEAGAEIEDTQGAISLIGLLSKFISGRDE